MKVLEVIFGAIFLIGVVMGVTGITGGGAVATFSSYGLMFTYFFLGFLFFKEGPASRGILISAIVMGVLYGFGVAGLQFNWMLYPGSGGTMKAGLLGLALTPVLIMAVHKGNKSVNNKRNWIRFAVVSCCYLITLLVSTDQIIEWKTDGRPLETEALKRAIEADNKESWEAYEEIRGQYNKEQMEDEND